MLAYYQFCRKSETEQDSTANTQRWSYNLQVFHFHYVLFYQFIGDGFISSYSGLLVYSCLICYYSPTVLASHFSSSDVHQSLQHPLCFTKSGLFQSTHTVPSTHSQSTHSCVPYFVVQSCPTSVIPPSVLTHY